MYLGFVVRFRNGKKRKRVELDHRLSQQQRKSGKRKGIEHFLQLANNLYLL